MFFINRLHGFYMIVLIIRTLEFSYCVSEGKIVGGSLTTIRKHPHAIYLDANCKGIQWICGSSVLNQKIVLTAAHCVDECDFRKSDTIHTVGGNEDIGKEEVSREVVSKYVHKKYEEQLILNDIAVLKINKDFPLDANIKRVIIPASQYPRPRIGSVAGWGIINEKTFKVSKILKVVKQKVRGKKTCCEIGDLHPGMFCAGSTEPTDSHPSYGDSGSALMASNYQQIGLVSFRTPSLPALMVYTNVTYYYKWISANSVNIFCRKGRS